jgi:hypothetical protein
MRRSTAGVKHGGTRKTYDDAFKAKVALVALRETLSLFDGKEKKIILENKNNKVIIDGGNDSCIVDVKKDITLKAGGQLIIDADKGISNKGIKVNWDN